MVDISFVIPAYNCENYIFDCVSSILAIKALDIEVIIVNDGSKDSTLEIAQRLSILDNRVIVFDNSNSGVSMSRNIGLSHASGKYIFFVDSDDSIIFNGIELLFNYAVKNNADIISFGFKKLDGNKETNYCFHENKTFVMCNNKDNKSFYYYYFDDRYGTAVWNKLFKREFLTNNDISFKTYGLVNSEDQLFNYQAINQAKCICVFTRSYYRYYVRGGSLSRTLTNSSIIDRNVNSFRCITNYSSNHNLKLRSTILNYYYLQTLLNISSLDICYFKASYKKLYDDISLTEKMMNSFYHNEKSYSFNMIIKSKKRLIKYFFVSILVRLKLKRLYVLMLYSFGKQKGKL